MIIAQTFNQSLQPMGNNGNGKGGGKPVVPEPATTGFVVVGFAILVYIYMRYVRPRNRCACHRHKS